MELSSTTPNVLTVRRFTELAREQLEEAFSDVRVEGEISNYKQHASGHCYFTLKDAHAQVRCVMWRHIARALYFAPSDGMLVRLYGKASIYEKRGDFQLITRAMRHAGEGGLQKAFEELKRTLQLEGLFDREHKKPIPPIPSRIGIVTSGSGAALQDILSIIERRFPLIDVLVYPVHVQGPQAAPSICEAIETFNALVTREEYRVELLIVGRGGGSLEDLWAFNEERVARAIFESTLPVISAVGHETDFTIADFVADCRAATPSMAAELVAPDRAELAAYLHNVCERSREQMSDIVDRHRRRIEAIVTAHSFNKPVDMLNQYKQQVDNLAVRLDHAGDRYLERLKGYLDGAQQQLELLDPRRPLKKGYAIVEQDGQFVRSARALRTDHPATLHFDDGKHNARITD